MRSGRNQLSSIINYIYYNSCWFPMLIGVLFFIVGILFLTNIIPQYRSKRNQSSDMQQNDSDRFQPPRPCLTILSAANLQPFEANDSDFNDLPRYDEVNSSSFPIQLNKFVTNTPPPPEYNAIIRRIPESHSI
ncbi:hypothetical protein QR98_0050350 [Sarcoptes scabiei]|uniref:Uncharacterized protein n=1 Tax=Sarcoptes scabiei TaxID=52283 RepID=A0A132A6G0_SARSC|nr:hypothetical protein QR98_0050350 [Sarcoptes scabiei]